MTSPTPGQVVEGVVKIVEDRGGVDDALCRLFGARASSRITVTRLSDSKIVFDQTRSAPGAWTAEWDSRDEPEDGDFRIRSTAQDRTTSSFCFNPQTTLSDLTVRLENTKVFVDDGGAGEIRINAYRSTVRVVTADGYDSGIRSTEVRVVDVPTPAAPSTCDPTGDPTACAPGAPGVAAWCTDPSSSTFIERLLLEGPQGCITGAPPAPAPPGPPNPPDPNDPDPVEPPDACDLDGRTRCDGRLYVLDHKDGTLLLAGAFDPASRRFAAAAATTDEPRGWAMRHLPEN